MHPLNLVVPLFDFSELLVSRINREFLVCRGKPRIILVHFSPFSAFLRHQQLQLRLSLSFRLDFLSSHLALLLLQLILLLLLFLFVTLTLAPLLLPLLELSHFFPLLLFSFLCHQRFSNVFSESHPKVHI